MNYIYLKSMSRKCPSFPRAPSEASEFLSHRKDAKDAEVLAHHRDQRAQRLFIFIEPGDGDSINPLSLRGWVVAGLKSLSLLMWRPGVRDAFLLDRIYRIHRILPAAPGVFFCCLNFIRAVALQAFDFLRVHQCSTPINKIYRMEQDNFRTLSFSKSYPVKSRKSVMEAVSLGYAIFCQA